MLLERAPPMRLTHADGRRDAAGAADGGEGACGAGACRRRWQSRGTCQLDSRPFEAFAKVLAPGRATTRQYRQSAPATGLSRIALLPQRHAPMRIADLC